MEIKGFFFDESEFFLADNIMWNAEMKKGIVRQIRTIPSWACVLGLNRGGLLRS
jgi:hypothetical protein